MIKPRPVTAAGFACALLSLFLWEHATRTATAESPGLKLEAQLIWGTNDPQSPDPNHKAVDADVLKKLSSLPLKWSNYFSVNRKGFFASPAAIANVTLSDKFRMEVRNLDGTRLEVAFFGRGEPVLRRTQSLPRGEILVLAGNAPNDTAWLVTLKRVE